MLIVQVKSLSGCTKQQLKNSRMHWFILLTEVFFFEVSKDANPNNRVTLRNVADSLMDIGEYDQVHYPLVPPY